MAHICETCGDEFEGYPGNANTYCSRGCMSEGYKGDFSGERQRNEDLDPEDTPNYGREFDDEWVQKMKEADRPSGKDHPTYGRSPQANWIEVEETNHKVRSRWERDLDIILHESELEYEYEPETFELGDTTYTPDFTVGDTVIEVKGYANERSLDKAERFMNQYPEYQYVVLGDKMPCDIHYEWSDKDKVMEELQ